MLNWIALIFIFLSYSNSVFAARICERFKYIACPGVFSGGRSSGASLPSRSSSFSFNPSGISPKKGFGIEVIKYVNSFDFSIFSGTGVVGSGLSSTNNEGTYFGNIPYESDAEYQVRKLRTDKFKPQKYSAALSFMLIGNSKRKKKKGPQLSVGLVGKYNDETSFLSSGGGVSFGWGFINGGVSRFWDEGRDGNNITETYYSDILSGGIKIFNIAADYIYIKNHTEKVTTVHMVTASFFFKNSMVTFGRRNENHGHGAYERPTKTFSTTSTRDFTSFLGVQVHFKSNFLIGGFYNYYLNNELSFTSSLFF